MKTLRETLPKASKIKPTYVHADSSAADLKLPLKGASVSVLGPERDIDFFYLGREGDPALRHALKFIDTGLPAVAAAVPKADEVAMPTNLDPADFRNLRSRMLSTALAFAELDGKVCNNTSVVLLIEWKGKRLLFVGDAEWDGAFKEGKKANCAWNIMWNKRKKLLDGPLAFLKIGHHGSENATPWGKGEPLDILNAILPVAGKAKAKAVVSTQRGRYETIPRTELLAEIGKRVSPTPRTTPRRSRRRGSRPQTCRSSASSKRKFFAEPQPLRTDLERMLAADKGFIEVEIEA